MIIRSPKVTEEATRRDAKNQRFLEYRIGTFGACAFRNNLAVCHDLSTLQVALYEFQIDKLRFFRHLSEL